MSAFVYDGYIGLVRTLDGITCTCHAVGTGYSPDPTHVDVDDVDTGNILGSETSVLTCTVTANTLTVTCASDSVTFDPMDTETLAGFAWVDADDLLVFWQPIEAVTATDPQTVDFPDGLYTLPGGA